MGSFLKVCIRGSQTPPCPLGFDAFFYIAPSVLLPLRQGRGKGFCSWMPSPYAFTEKRILGTEPQKGAKPHLCCHLFGWPWEAERGRSPFQQGWTLTSPRASAGLMPWEPSAHPRVPNLLLGLQSVAQRGAKRKRAH